MTQLPGETPNGMPDLATVRAWLDLSTDQLSDVDLSRLWESARTAQNNACTVDALAYADYPAALVLALLRRVSRSLAAEDLPLGYLGDGEFGPSRLLNYDAVIEELEGPWRKVVVA